MKAAVFCGVGQPLEVQERPDPEPGDDGVVIAVRRCGICSSDLHYTDGHSEKYQWSPNSLLGHEISGEVVAKGRDVSRFKVGDRIATMLLAGCSECWACAAGRPTFCTRAKRVTGGYSQYALTYENAMIKLPNSLSFADGALVEPLAVALHGVTQCQMQPGARVLVFGAGPIGLSAAYWARRLGAGQIALAELNRNRETYARNMGVDHFIVASESDRPLAELASEALGGPPDVVLECVGMNGMIAQAIACIRPAGTIGVIGYCMTPDSFIPADAMHKEARLIFSLIYSLNEYEHVARTLDLGHVEPRSMITGVIGLDELPETFERLRGVTPDVKVQVDPHLS